MSIQQTDSRVFSSELAVIGSGLAGFAASVFACNRGISVAQAGSTGAIAYTTGYFDLLGMLSATDQSLDDPWDGLVQLRTVQPDHPLSKVDPDDIRQGFLEFTQFLGKCGIHYSTIPGANLTALSPAGTLKKTLSMPETMLPGTTALAGQKETVIVDFHGLKGFSGRQVVANLEDQWPGLRSIHLKFPDMDHGEIYPEVMARALEVPATQQKLASLLKDQLGSAQYIGLPAILGMHEPDKIREQLEKLTGCTIFEIPTMPPSVPGIRLRELMEQELPLHGVTLIPQQKVRDLAFTDSGVTLTLKDNFGPININAKAALLATGRFLSGGLEAKIDGIHEPLLNLPVTQPTEREDWYREKYTDPRGHQIHLSGLEVNDSMRPLGVDGTPFHPRLFCAGVILSGQDWIRQRCGAGVAIATAYKAVKNIDVFLNTSNKEGK